MRAMDRAAKQAERQRVVRQQALHRQAHLDASARAAAAYEEIVEALTGAHRVPLSRVGWLTTATAPELGAPDQRRILAELQQRVQGSAGEAEAQKMVEEAKSCNK